MILLALLFSDVVAKAELTPPPPGPYALVGKVETCATPLTGLCVRVHEGRRSERVLRVEGPRWNTSLRTAVGLELQLSGKIVGQTLTLDQAPRVHRLGDENLFDDRARFEAR